MCHRTVCALTFPHWVCVFVYLCVCVWLHLSPCLNKCIVFQIALHKRQSRLPPPPPEAISPTCWNCVTPLNLGARRSIQTKLPFVHNDVTRRCMRNIADFITLSPASQTLILAPRIFLFSFFLSFFLQLSFPFRWAAGERRKPRDGDGCRFAVWTRRLTAQMGEG